MIVIVALVAVVKVATTKIMKTEIGKVVVVHVCPQFDISVIHMSEAVSRCTSGKSCELSRLYYELVRKKAKFVSAPLYQSSD